MTKLREAKSDLAPTATITSSEITMSDTLLFRQAHPSFVHNSRPSSQVFRPSRNDNGLMSVDNGSKTSAAEAFIHYTEKRRLKSEGTWALSIAECNAESLKGYDSPVTEEPQNPAHAHIDFNDFGNSAIEGKAKRLRAKAEARGKQHP